MLSFLITCFVLFVVLPLIWFVGQLVLSLLFIGVVMVMGFFADRHDARKESN